MARTCPSCGATVGSNANFCGSCAAQLPNTVVRTGNRNLLIVAAIGIPVGIVLIVAVALIIYFLSGKGGSPITERFVSRSPATQELQKQFEKVFTKCGDSYYADQLFWGGLGQFKDVTFSTQELPLNQADRANAVEWKGTGTVSSRLIRFYSDKRWGDWHTPEEWMPLVFAIGKRRGEWQSQVSDGRSKLIGSLASAKKASCDQIPGENP